MRGEERRQRPMLMVLNVEQRIAKEHPLRRIKQLAESVLKGLSPVFDQMHSAMGRPSIPPERLLKESLLMALYTVRSERMFCGSSITICYFAGSWTWSWTSRASTIRPSRATARLLAHEVAGEFFRGVVEQARALRLLSSEHFTVDGTLIKAWTSLKSFKRKEYSR